jgi:hypothetical protein
LTVDAIDLVHTQDDINVYIIVSSDSDFLPLVVKLKEKRKMVIGVGNATSADSFVKTCNRFLFVEHMKHDMEEMKQEENRRKLLYQILECMGKEDEINAGLLNEKLIKKGVLLGNKSIKRIIVSMFPSELNCYYGKNRSGPFISRIPNEV